MQALFYSCLLCEREKPAGVHGFHQYISWLKVFPDNRIFYPHYGEKTRGKESCIADRTLLVSPDHVQQGVSRGAGGHFDPKVYKTAPWWAVVGVVRAFETHLQHLLFVLVNAFFDERGEILHCLQGSICGERNKGRCRGMPGMCLQVRNCNFRQHHYVYPGRQAGRAPVLRGALSYPLCYTQCRAISAGG